VLRGFDAEGELICDPTPDLFPRLALCGGSAREVSTFVTPGSFLVMTDTCTPAPNVQAMIITRAALSQLDATALQNYLNGGGIVITSFGASYAVYNMVHGTSVAEPTAFAGACNDNVNPLIPLNEADAFWQANPYAPDNVNGGGCGYPLNDLPGITALGSSTDLADVVSLGYIKVGAGRLWLAESDWPDGESSFSAQSLRLMRYMLRTR
jgi:hypothetical protein